MILRDIFIISEQIWLATIGPRQATSNRWFWSLVSGWTSHPGRLKMRSSKWIVSPRFGGKYQTNLWVATTHPKLTFQNIPPPRSQPLIGIPTEKLIFWHVSAELQCHYSGCSLPLSEAKNSGTSWRSSQRLKEPEKLRWNYSKVNLRAAHPMRFTP